MPQPEFLSNNWQCFKGEKKESEARRGENKGGEKSGEEEEEGEGEEEEGEEEEEEEEGSTLHILCRLFCPLLHCDA